MVAMATYMDYTVSSMPLRIVDRAADKSKLNVRSLSILSAGHLPMRTLYRRGARFHHHAVVYIANGGGTYRINDGEVQTVSKDSFFFFFPGASFDYGPEPGGSWDEYYFTIEGSRIGEWLDSWLTDLDKVRQVERDDSRQSKFERIFLMMESGVPANLDRSALLLEQLAYELILSSQPVSGTTSPEQLTKLLDDIGSSVQEPFDSGALCERHHISISTLRRLIHKHSGYSLNEYVHRLKISEAKSLLLNGGRSVKEIASSLGFRDEFYFSRLFKKYVGVAPRHYREHV